MWPFVEYSPQRLNTFFAFQSKVDTIDSDTIGNWNVRIEQSTTHQNHKPHRKQLPMRALWIMMVCVSSDLTKIKKENDILSSNIEKVWSLNWFCFGYNQLNRNVDQHPRKHKKQFKFKDRVKVIDQSKIEGILFSLFETVIFNSNLTVLHPNKIVPLHQSAFSVQHC